MNKCKFQVGDIIAVEDEYPLFVMNYSSWGEYTVQHLCREYCDSYPRKDIENECHLITDVFRDEL